MRHLGTWWIWMPTLKPGMSPWKNVFWSAKLQSHWKRGTTPGS
jgi:hypothetical protein